MKYKKIISIILCVSLVFSSACSRKKQEPLTYQGTAFDTVISIQIFDSEDTKLLENCQELCAKYESLFSRTLETSEVYKINHSNGEPVQVSPETAYLIQQGLYYGQLSDGAFDITIGSISSIWDFTSGEKIIPSADSINEALAHINYQCVKVTDNTVQLTDPLAILDLGAIAKGYIADKLKEFLISEGVEHALINLGGNILAIGTKTDGSEYNIGITKPFTESGEYISSVKIKDQSVVTSGTYQRYFTIDDTIYHHILSPSTGYPCDNPLNGVTIVAESSLVADAFSTTCFLLGKEKGMELIEETDGVEAVFIDTDNQLYYSSGF